jgi:serine/threonine protein kinase
VCVVLSEPTFSRHHPAKEFVVPQLCPTAEELTQYLAGNVSDNQFEQLDEHIAACPSCQGQLEQISANSEPIVKLVSAAATVNSTSLPKDLRTCLEQIRQHRPRHQPIIGEADQISSQSPLVQIRDYRILSCIGEGGMGSVYHGFHTRLQRPVAIKVLRRDRVHKADAVQRFLREMEVVGRLEHPSIVKALDAGEQDGVHYLVMEYISGVDAYQLRRALGPMSIANCCEITLQAARALDYAHEQRILHRDIKSSNLMITTEGRVVLLDLGLAQFFGPTVESNLSKSDHAVGTLNYMAPEQLAGNSKISAAADIYSLGVTMCELLSGKKLPVRGPTSKLYPAVLKALPKLPPELDQLLGAMLAIDPTKRPRSMRDVVIQLTRFTSGSKLASLVEQYRTNILKASADASGSAVVAPPVQGEINTDKPSAEIETQENVIPKLAVTSSSMKKATSNALTPHQRFMRRRRAGLGAAALILLALPWILYSFVPWGALGARVAAHVPPNETEEVTVISGEEPPLVAATIPNAAEVPADPLSGQLDILTADEIPSQLLRDGRVQAENIQDKKRFTLESGINSLPLGEYRIYLDGPENLRQVENIVVASGAARRLNLTATLVQPFQYPSIPDQVGAFCTYHGTIEHAGLRKGEKVRYTLRLKVLAIEGNSPDGPVSKWLMVEALTHHATGDLIETGYLKIDSETWENEQRLKVVEGLVVASSPTIDQFLQDYFPALGTDKLVVPYSPDEDLLEIRASSALPDTRVSLQDFLVLYFGDETILAAHDTIKKLRPELPNLGERNTWLDTVDGGRGPIECHIVSSLKRKTDMKDVMAGYSMARSKQEPFGFLRLEVKSPLLTALCVVKTSSILSVKEEEIKGEIENLRKLVISPDVPMVESINFDIAQIPAENSTTTWRGYITVGLAPLQSITATATALGKESVGGVVGRWLEIEITSMRSLGAGRHWEKARILIDEEAYGRSEFRLLKGWVAVGDKTNVFEIPTDLNLDPVINARLTLLSEPGYNFIGATEVMSMLLGAEFTPQTYIGSLRPYIGGMNGNQARRVSFGERTLKNGQKLRVKIWQPPLNSKVDYEIARSNEIPFNIVDVDLEVTEPTKIKIKLGVESPSDKKADAQGVPFEENDDWADLAAQTSERVEKAQKENWRVWEWTTQERTLRVYAEFGGLVYFDRLNRGTKLRGNLGNILLKNRDGQLLQIPLSSLSADDIASLENGRYWPTARTVHKRYHGTLFNSEVINLERIPDLKSTKHTIDKLGDEDKSWVNTLKTTEFDNGAKNRSFMTDRVFADYSH